jgi:phosphopantothenate--cysteine ligase
MKILITSGGTKVPIDRVRDITNMSKGTFGSKISEQLLKLDQDVFFLKSKGSRSPMSATVDFAANNHGEPVMAAVENAQALYTRYFEHWREMEYTTFNQYRDCLEHIVKVEKPDVVVLAAAASDYGVANFVNGKIRSNDDYKIFLEPLPKLIYYIKEWLPTAKLVGFKLLVESTPDGLIAAAKRSIADNKCDLMVANDLQDIKDNKHRVFIVRPDGSDTLYNTDPNDSNYLARMVAENIIKI